MRMGFIISSGEPSRCMLFFFFFSFEKEREREKCCGWILKHSINIYYLNLYYRVIELVDAKPWNNCMWLVTWLISTWEEIEALASMLQEVTLPKPPSVDLVLAYSATPTALETSPLFSHWTYHMERSSISFPHSIPSMCLVHDLEWPPLDGKK